MKLDRRLNAVISVTRPNLPDIHIHHIPISREIYESHFYLIQRTITKMYDDELPFGACMRTAYLMMRRVAAQMGEGEREMLDKNLLPEIWRLTNVIMPDKVTGGWSSVPFDVVLKNKELSDDDEAEVKNAICFFTSASWVHKLDELETGIYPILNKLGARTTSLNSTEFANSLPTWMRAENTGAKAALLSTAA